MAGSAARVWLQPGALTRQGSSECRCTFQIPMPSVWPKPCGNPRWKWCSSWSVCGAVSCQFMGDAMEHTGIAESSIGRFRIKECHRMVGHWWTTMYVSNSGCWNWAPKSLGLVEPVRTNFHREYCSDVGMTPVELQVNSYWLYCSLVIQSLHNGVGGGHIGLTKLWPKSRMRIDAEDWCRQCLSCTSWKSPT